MEIDDPKLMEIWNQKSIPILFQREQGYPLLVHLPNSGYYQNWLRGRKQRGKKRRNPVWNNQFKCWEVPVAWFEELVKRLLNKYGKVYVIQVYRERNICAPACWNARGSSCVCSCMGVNHGKDYPGGKWYVVSEALAIQWGERKYACRLITK